LIGPEAPAPESRYPRERLEKEPLAVMKELLEMNEFMLPGALASIVESAPESHFILHFLQMSGVNAPLVAASLPRRPGPFGKVLDSRKVLAAHFPQFEGNFALTAFLKEHRDAPVPIRQPPICGDSAKQLQSHVDIALQLLRHIPSPVAAEEAFLAYQVTAFVFARLQQAGVAVGWITNSAVPLFKAQHEHIKRAFANVTGSPLHFPAAPFNFQDPNFLKRIRPPPSRSLQ
jgi:hypothetical protein